MTQEEFWQDIKTGKLPGDLICVPEGICLSQNGTYKVMRTAEPTYATIVKRITGSQGEYFEIYIKNESWLLMDRLTFI